MSVTSMLFVVLSRLIVDWKPFYLGGSVIKILQIKGLVTWGFFSAILDDSRQCSTTSATAGDPQRQKYVKLTLMAYSNSVVNIFTYEDA